MRFIFLFLTILFSISWANAAQAKSNKTWLALKIDNPGSLTKDQVNLIQMNMVRLEDLPPMFYTAVARFDMETNEISKPSKLFKLPMHHDGYVFLKVKPAGYIFAEEGQIDTYKICYKSYKKIYSPTEGAINFLGTLDRNLIIKNIENLTSQDAQNETSLIPRPPTQSEINNLKQYMQGNKKVSRIKGDIVALNPQDTNLTAFSEKSLKKLNCK